MAEHTAPASANDGGRYLDMYRQNYGEFLVEQKLVQGRDPIGMFLCRQPAGDYPDEPLLEYNLQMSNSEDIPGEYDLGAGRFSHNLRKGECFFVPDGTPAHYRLESEHEIFGLGLPKLFLQAALDDARLASFSLEPLLKSATRDAVTTRLVRDAWSEACAGGDQGALFMDTTVLAIVARMVALTTKAISSGSQQYRLTDAAYRRIADYVESNVDSTIRMKTLASLAGLNEYEFARQFRARTGKPPYQWVINRRLDKAEQMLKRSGHSLADIAYACGFSSQAHMTSLFSRKRGVTPLQIRQATA